ncbi:MAG: 3'(2'),5'-bisphosphate nucleotidase CysQ [bacterium]
MSLLETAKKAVEAANKTIIEVYEAGDIDVEQKDDGFPVTIADQRSNEVIESILSETGIPFLSEESAHTPYEERKNWNRVWIVDPLDGTKSFIARTGDFAVHVALVENGVVILGVVGVPVYGQVYWAEKGKGAFRQGRDETIEQIHVGQNSPKRIFASRSHMNEKTQQFLDEHPDAEILHMGSSRKFLAVAEGEADLYPRFGPTMEWDSAAPQIIVEEAGGSVLESESQKPLRYNKQDLYNPFFIVSGE